jgi:hypothetical protein
MVIAGEMTGSERSVPGETRELSLEEGPAVIFAVGVEKGGELSVATGVAVGKVIMTVANNATRVQHNNFILRGSSRTTHRKSNAHRLLTTVEAYNKCMKGWSRMRSSK